MTATYAGAEPCGATSPNACQRISPATDQGRARPPGITVEQLFRQARGPHWQDPATVRLHPRIACRAVFMSDFHLGSPLACARNIAQFLKHIEPEYIYLMGDIVDCWQMGGLDLFKIHKHGGAHTEVLQRLMKMERRGVRLIYIPGNHDEWFRSRLREQIPIHGFVTLFEATHATLTGRRILVIHGDSFDELVRASRWLSLWGTRLYEKLAVLSTTVDRWRAYGRINRILRRLGLREDWSLSLALRQAADRATYSRSYERAALAYLHAKNAQITAWNESNPDSAPVPLYDEIMCGHTHIPMRRCVHEGETSPGASPIVFSNTGCWVGDPGENTRAEHRVGWLATQNPSCTAIIEDAAEHRVGWLATQNPSCTAIIEDANGQLQHVQWVPQVGVVRLSPDSDGYIHGYAHHAGNFQASCPPGQGAPYPSPLCTASITVRPCNEPCPGGASAL